jgi:hypothetical protein
MKQYNKGLLFLSICCLQELGKPLNFEGSYHCITIHSLYLLTFMWHATFLEFHFVLYFLPILVVCLILKLPNNTHGFVPF